MTVGKIKSYLKVKTEKFKNIFVKYNYIIYLYVYKLHLY